MDKTDTSEALSKAAKMQAIDSEIERIAAELREYGVLGVKSNLFESSGNRQPDINTVEEILQYLKSDGGLDPAKPVKVSELQHDIPCFLAKPSKTAPYTTRVGKVNVILCWKLTVHKEGLPDDQELYLFVDRDNKASFNVCTMQALRTKNGVGQPFLPLWAHRSLSSTEKMAASLLILEAINHPIER